MGSKSDGPSGPRPRFFIVGLSHFQRGIGHYTWLACKTDISEEVRSHQSNVISRFFVVPGSPADYFRTTNSIVFKLDPTKRSQIALLWTDSGHQSASICDFLKIFVSHRECRRASIQRRRSHIQNWWSEWSQTLIFHSWTYSFSAWYWPLYMASMQNDISEEVRSHQSNVISRIFVVPGPHTD